MERSGGKHIVRTLDFGEDKERNFLWFTMEYLRGVSLFELLQTEPILSVERTIRILRQVCEGLSAAHRRGIIHRDVKPANLFLSTGPDGQADWVYILDFGVAKVVADGALKKTQTGMLIGTPYNMSPEQISEKYGTVDQRTDIYALGCVAYLMLTGRPPFQGEYQQILMSHILEEAVRPRQLNPNLPPALEDVLLRMMEKNPEKRFATMLEVDQALAECQRQINAASEPTQHLAAPPNLAKEETPTDRPLPLTKGLPTTTHGELSRTGRSALARYTVPGLVVALVALVGGLGVLSWRTTRQRAAEAEPAKLAVAARAAVEPATPLHVRPEEPSKVVLEVTPANANVLVDGTESTGPTPVVLAAEPGHRFHVEVKLDGYRTLNQVITIEAVDRRQLLRLEALPRRTAENGYLTVMALPFGEVLVDGKAVGTTPILNLALRSGMHTVITSNARLNKREVRRLRIEPGHHERVAYRWQP